MTAKTRMIRQPDISPEKQQLIDDLLASKLIGLRITDKFSLKSAKAYNNQFAGLGWMQKPAEPVKYKELNALLTLLHEGEMQRLKNLFTSATEDKAEMLQNFAVLDVMGNHAFNVFLHGRELFADEDAFRRYERGDLDLDLIFTQEARDKVNYWQSEQSLEQRVSLGPWLTAQEYINMAKTSLRKAKQFYPKIDFSKIPQLDDATANKESAGDTMLHLKTLLRDANAHMGGIFDSGQSFLLSDHIALGEKKWRDWFEDILKESLANNTPAMNTAQERKEEFGAYLAQHQYDPFVIVQFMMGVALNPEKELSIDELVQAGKKYIIDETLLKLAGSMHNPFDARIADTEREVARMLADAVEEPVLRHGIERNTALLVTNASRMRTEGHDVFPEIIQRDGAGFYLHQPIAQHDFIGIAAGRLDWHDFARIARHEFGHFIDHTNKFPLHRADPRALASAVRKDKIHLGRVDTVLDCTRHPKMQCGDDIDAYRKSIDVKKMLISAGIADDNMPESLDELQRYIQLVKSKIERFMQKDSKIAKNHYPTQGEQRAEIAAVMDELNGIFGESFIRQLLPNTSELFTQNRARHPAMGGQQEDIMAQTKPAPPRHTASPRVPANNSGYSVSR